MLTEEEARAKWCPFARVMSSAEGDGSNGNRCFDADMQNPKWARCIASACMAWRGQDRAAETGRKIPTSTSAVKPEGNWYWSHSVDGPVWVETAVERVGYCGLAGEP